MKSPESSWFFFNNWWVSDIDNWWLRFYQKHIKITIDNYSNYGACGCQQIFNCWSPSRWAPFTKPPYFWWGCSIDFGILPAPLTSIFLEMFKDDYFPIETTNLIDF